jgi:membrane protease YdiL (CAAX protease family)
VFASIELIILMIFGPLLLPWAGTLITGAVSTFAAAALANAITVRVYERGRLEDIGLGSVFAARNFLIGFLAGLATVILVAGLPLLTGMAKLVPAPEQPRSAASFLFVTVVLLIGAFGEELLFRGYGFQLLLRRWGAFATILPTSVLFAWAHSNNPSAGWMAMINTFLWGVLFGLCFLRSGDLWLAAGLHFGWNWTLPLFGIEVSGFPMSVIGHKMEWIAGPLWSGGGYGIEASVLTLAVIPFTVWALWKAPVGVTRPVLFDVQADEEAS